MGVVTTPPTRARNLEEDRSLQIYTGLHISAKSVLGLESATDDAHSMSTASYSKINACVMSGLV